MIPQPQQPDQAGPQQDSRMLQVASPQPPLPGPLAGSDGGEAARTAGLSSHDRTAQWLQRQLWAAQPQLDASGAAPQPQQAPALYGRAPVAGESSSSGFDSDEGAARLTTPPPPPPPPARAQLHTSLGSALDQC